MHTYTHTHIHIHSHTYIHAHAHIHTRNEKISSKVGVLVASERIRTVPKHTPNTSHTHTQSSQPTLTHIRTHTHTHTPKYVRPYVRVRTHEMQLLHRLTRVWSMLHTSLTEKLAMISKYSCAPHSQKFRRALAVWETVCVRVCVCVCVAVCVCVCVV